MPDERESPASGDGDGAASGEGATSGDAGAEAEAGSIDRPVPAARLLARPLPALHPLDDPARDAPHWRVATIPPSAIAVAAPIYDEARRADEQERRARAAAPPAAPRPRLLSPVVERPLSAAHPARVSVRVTVADGDDDRAHDHIDVIDRDDSGSA